MIKPSIPLKTRFCPSPTGWVHLGNMRTALFNHLLSVGQQGTFLLRIEDTDRTRSDERYTRAIMDDLRWLGLDWGEGPVWQSQRQATYDQYYEQLIQQGDAYPCFCTESQLALARKVQRASGRPPRYSGTCRHLHPNDVNQRLANGQPATLRFKVMPGQTIQFNDLVRGHQRFASDDLGDFIIRRTDGTSPFMFCNALDDALMGVTHVLRGEDHLTNTPRQWLILKALGLRIPEYGHISLIVGPDGSPLSKRHGSKSIQTLRDEGYLPMAVNNYLARLGHYYADEQFMTLAELSERFSIDALGKAPARFDLQQLMRWQKEALAHLSLEALKNWIGEERLSSLPEEQHDRFIDLIRPNVLFPSDVEAWVRLMVDETLNYDEKARALIKSAGPDYYRVALDALNNDVFDIKSVIEHLKSQLNLKGKTLFMPLRVALTARTDGPELDALAHLIGKKRVCQRLAAAGEAAVAS